MYCTTCGTNLDEQGRCPKCTPVQKTDYSQYLAKGIEKSMNLINSASKTLQDASKESDDNAYERGKLIVPDCICANEGEVTIKQYDFAKLRTILTLSFAECRLQITNKRLLIRAPGTSPSGRTVFHQEFKVNEIAGFEIKKGQRFSFFHFLLMLFITSAFAALGALPGMAGDKPYIGLRITFAVIFSLLLVAAYVFVEYIHIKKNAHNKHYILKQIVVALFTGLVAGLLFGKVYYIEKSVIVTAVIVGIPLLGIFIYNSIHLVFAPALTAVIKTKGGTPSLELKRKDLLAFILGKKDENCGFSQVLPWKDTELVIKEMGTIIDDLQTIGDAAVEKWNPRA